MPQLKNFGMSMQINQVEVHAVKKASGREPVIHLPAIAISGVAEAVTWRRQIDVELECTYEKMREVSQVTKNLKGRIVYLEVFRQRAPYGASLRWRSATHTHMSEAKAIQLIEAMPSSMRNWYQHVFRQARFLNLQERVIRNNLKHAQDALDIFAIRN